MRSKTGYWLGGSLVVAGVAGAVLWFVFSLVNFSDEVDDFQRAAIPGEANVRLGRKYVIYYEGTIVVDGAVPPFDVEVADARTGASLPIAPYDGSLTYTVSGRDGSAVATVTPSNAGEYVVRTDGDPGPTGASVALGRSLAAPLLRWVLGTFAIWRPRGRVGRDPARGHRHPPLQSTPSAR
jgi:hypothetical protein